MEHLSPEEWSAEELFRYHRKLAGSHDLLERLKVLWVAAQLRERLARCSDHEVGNLLSLVQDSLGIFSPDFTVCEFAKRRLRRSSSKARKEGWKAARDAGVGLLNAEAALFRASIPHMLLPFQRDRFASSVFLVPRVTEARACLLHAGFRSVPNNETGLMDSQTNRAIRLVEAGRKK